MENSKLTPADDFDTGPKFLKVEPIENFVCQAPQQPDGERYLSFGGMPFPWVPHVRFQLWLNPETTQEEAEALAATINKHCPAPFAQIFDRSLIED